MQTPSETHSKTLVQTSTKTPSISSLLNHLPNRRQRETPSGPRNETLNETLNKTPSGPRNETLNETLNETPSETPRGESEENDTSSIQVIDEIGARVKRGNKWLAWEDRALVKQVLADDPFTVRGETMKRWETVAKNLELVQPTRIHRSAISCKSRCAVLIKAHKIEDSLSLQKTGTDEEVSNYTRDMDELVMRSDQHARDPEVKAEAKRKLEELENDGKKVRDDAMKGQVREEGSRSQGKSQEYKKAKQNQLDKLTILSEQLEEQEEEGRKHFEQLQEQEKVFQQEMRGFQAAMLYHQQRSTELMENMTTELQKESCQRATEHRELMQALIAMVHTRQL